MKIFGWKLVIYRQGGKFENMSHLVPKRVATEIDGWLNELEGEEE